jgi:lysozyme family protein
MLATDIAGAPALAGRDRYRECVRELFEIEGGFSNHKADPGGATMGGVTWKVYNAYRDFKRLPRQDVRLITTEERLELFYLFYWLPCHAHQLPPGLDLETFDFSVNSGVGTAIDKLQEVLGVRVDAHFGAVTASAVQAAYLPDLITRYMARRREFGRGLPNYYAFEVGWEGRWTRIERSALRAAGMQLWAAQVTPAPAMFDGNGIDVEQPVSCFQTPDEISEQQGRAIEQPLAPPIGTEAGLAGSGGASFTMALPNIIARSTYLGRWSWVAFAIAVLSEPWFWATVAFAWGAAATYLWRRKHK